MRISNTLNKLISMLVLMSIGSLANAETPDGWTSDFEQAKVSAADRNRKMLILFTGSDWCIWCKRLNDEILSTETFRNWANENIVLVYLDYPRQDYRSEAVRRQNEELDDIYEISGFPTAIVANASGRQLARLSYMEGGPKTFIRAIKRAGH